MMPGDILPASCPAPPVDPDTDLGEKIKISYRSEQNDRLPTLRYRGRYLQFHIGKIAHFFPQSQYLNNPRCPPMFLPITIL